MARRKELVYFDGKLKGKYLTDDECRLLDNIRNLSDNLGEITDMRNLVYNLPKDSIDQILITGSNEGVELPIGQLDPQQTTGVGFMFVAKRMILGDSVGLGKTVEVAGLINLLKKQYEKEGKPFKFLFLGEKTSLQELRSKLVQFTGDFVDLTYGEKAHIEKYVTRVYNTGVPFGTIAPHSLLTHAKFFDYLREYEQFMEESPYDLLIIDESSILSNTTTATYKKAQAIAKMFERIILLNATAFESNLMMFYSQLNFMDDSLLPARTTFQKEYEEQDFSGHYPMYNGKYKHQERFRNLISYRYLKRTRRDLGYTMTNCSAEIIKVPISKVQRELQARSSMGQMIIDCPWTVDSRISKTSATTPKLGGVAELLQTKWKDVDSVLIYAHYKESQQGLEQYLTGLGYSVGVMNGETSTDERNRIIEEFKAGGIKILITNVQKGLDFDNCNHAVFYRYDTNPNKMVQFEGRMTRGRNIDNKHIAVIVSEGQELKTLKETVAQRAKNSAEFSGSDFSMILDLLEGKF